MIVNQYKPFIAELLAKEPWRNNKGEKQCTKADLDWDGTKLWVCKHCGRVGMMNFTLHTMPIMFYVLPSTSSSKTNP